MYKAKGGEVAIMIVALLTALILNLGVLALTAWVFHVSGSAWSFAILLFLFSTSSKSKDNY